MEREPRTPESGFTNPELETREAAKTPERTAETSAEKNQEIEAARQKIEHQPQAERHEAHEKHKEPNHHRLSHKAAYKETMASIQRHLPTASRAFSKVIHNPVVDKTSEVVGATVLRPSVTLGATSTALIVGGVTYLVAKHYGYHLTGSVVLLSLLVGGLLGIVIEGISKLFTRKS